MKTIGIVGGMGALATVDLFYKLVKNVNAIKDQEYPHIIIDNNPNIPDRTNAILYDGESPVDELLKSIEKLQNSGAEMIGIGCNTAHYFIDELEYKCDIPIVNMIDETAKYLYKSAVKVAGILATKGTIQAGVYEKYLDQVGINYFLPNEYEQEEIMDLIYNGVKSFDFRYGTESVLKIVDRMSLDGADAIVLGCTELPIAIKNGNSDIPMIDPTNILAQALLRYSGYELRMEAE